MENIIIETNIDETNNLNILNKIQLLITERNKFNIHEIPPPNHIKRDAYDDGKAYKAAKELYRINYKNAYNDRNNEIKRLQKINTELCIEVKKKEDDIALKDGTFYNADENEYLNHKKLLKIEMRKNINKRHYQNNKEELRLRALIKAHNEKIPEVDLIKKESGNIFNHLLLSTEIINPVCACGKRCDVINFKNLQKHSKIQKHLLFNSIIRLVHYKRQRQRIITITKNINNELVSFKKVVRVKKDGKSFTVTNKTESEIIKYYNALTNEFDENKIKLRPSYIDKVNYTKKYKDKLLRLKLRTINLKRVNGK
tara:strand:- start:112 stop:1047 length:936 start_codon:yes stop_codon:yes gene_type:complete